MSEALKEKQLQLTIIILKTGEEHLRSIGLQELADELKGIIVKCENESIKMAADPVPGILMEGEQE